MIKASFAQSGIRRGVRALALLGLGLVAAASQAAPPLEAFARSPAIRAPDLSPSGRYLTYLVTEGDRQTAYVIDLHVEPLTGVPALSTNDAFLNISYCAFKTDERLVCLILEEVRERRFDITMPSFTRGRLVAVDRDGRKLVELLKNSTSSQFSWGKSQIASWLYGDPESILVETDDDGNGRPGLQRVNVVTGKRSLILDEQRDVSDWYIDQNGVPRLGVGLRDDSRVVWKFRLDANSPWQELGSYEALRESGMDFVAFTPKAEEIVVSADHEGRKALFLKNLRTDEPPKLLFSHPVVDVTRVVTHPRTSELLYAVYTDEHTRRHFFSEPERELYKAIGLLLKGDGAKTIGSINLDRSVMLLEFQRDDVPTMSYVFDSRRRKMLPVGSDYPELLGHKLARMEPVSYPARDGTMIPGYLTMPPGHVEGSPPPPAIVLPHGGPIARDTSSFDWLVQYLATRGYAVLQPNFRGSWGYGQAWQAAGYSAWATLMQDDIADGAAWLHKSGKGDPARTCIVGWSFGGYSALMSASRYGDRYRCSASIAGVSDLEHLITQQRMAGNPAIARIMVGLDAETRRQHSPIEAASAVAMPVLLVHGSQDWIVRSKHSVDMAAALKKYDKPHELVLLNYGNHSLTRSEDRLAMLRKLDAFLAQHLQGPGSGQQASAR